MQAKITKLFICVTFLLHILTFSKSQLTYKLIGGVTESQFTIKAKTQDGSSINVYSNNTFIGAFPADSDNYHTITLSNLTSSTLYSLNLVSNQINNYVSVTTFPKLSTNVSDLTFVAGSNIYSKTNSFIFNRILGLNPKFFMLLGNLYSDSTQSTAWTDLEAKYLEAFTLNSTIGLFQTVPLMYSFNDNDFAGSLSTADYPNVVTVNRLYRKMIPSYPLGDNGIYQSFRYGNVLFLMIDSRSFLQPELGIFLGSTQVNWIVSQLQAAAIDPQIGAVFISLTQVWNYVKSAYDWDMIKQNYYSVLDSASADKKQVGDTVRTNFNFNRPTLAGFKSVMMIVGERTTAFDEGTWNNFGNFPIAVCGPLDFWQQCRGGPYSHGSFHDNQNNYCQFKVYTDPDTKNTCINSKGVITTDKTNHVDQTVWMFDTCQPVTFRGRVNLKCPIDYTEKLVNSAITIGAIAFIYILFFVVIYGLSIKSLSFTKVKDA